MATIVQTRDNHLLGIHGLILILGLIVQYILGMITNLFMTFPDTTIEGKLWEYAWTQISEASHIILGLLLFIGAVLLLIRALRYKNRIWTIAASTGLAGILLAIYGGVRFIPTQNDPYSLVMSIAFIVALLALVWGFYASKEQP